MGPPIERPFGRGEVVIVPFPFSDLSDAKRRPALVVAAPEGDDRILCQITSRTVRDHYAVPIQVGSFQEGGLRVPSNVRPNRIFTADLRLILYTAGCLQEEAHGEVVRRIKSILDAPAHP